MWIQPQHNHLLFRTRGYWKLSLSLDTLSLLLGALDFPTLLLLVFFSSLALLNMTVNPSAEAGLFTSHSPNLGNGRPLSCSYLLVVRQWAISGHHTPHPTHVVCAQDSYNRFPFIASLTKNGYPILFISFKLPYWSSFGDVLNKGSAPHSDIYLEQFS